MADLEFTDSDFEEVLFDDFEFEFDFEVDNWQTDALFSVSKVDDNTYMIVEKDSNNQCFTIPETMKTLIIRMPIIDKKLWDDILDRNWHINNGIRSLILQSSCVLYVPPLLVINDLHLYGNYGLNLLDYIDYRFLHLHNFISSSNLPGGSKLVEFCGIIRCAEDIKYIPNTVMRMFIGIPINMTELDLGRFTRLRELSVFCDNLNSLKRHPLFSDIELPVCYYHTTAYVDKISLPEGVKILLLFGKFDKVDFDNCVSVKNLIIHRYHQYTSDIKITEFRNLTNLTISARAKFIIDYRCLININQLDITVYNPISELTGGKEYQYHRKKKIITDYLPSIIHNCEQLTDLTIKMDQQLAVKDHIVNLGVMDNLRQLYFDAQSSINSLRIVGNCKNLSVIRLNGVKSFYHQIITPRGYEIQIM
jgi:uncharacterized protein with HEPN domain